MLRDIVIDANVFLHAENHVEVRREACILLISLLRESGTCLCVDEGCSIVEERWLGKTEQSGKWRFSLSLA